MIEFYSSYLGFLTCSPLVVAIILDLRKIQNNCSKYMLFLISISLAFYNEIIDINGLLLTTISLLFVIYARLYGHTSKNITTIFKSILVILTSASIFHVLPGFHNLILINNISLSLSSAPLRCYVNFDKLYFIASSLMIFSPSIMMDGIKGFVNTVHDTIKILTITLLFLLSTAYILHFVKFDMKFDVTVFAIWSINNLFIVCLGEEVLYRYVIIEKTIIYLNKYKKYAKIISISISSFLFSLEHLPNVPFAMLALIAGIFYSILYLKNRNVVSSICLHFLVNTTHFIFFSYPYLKHN